MALEVEKHAKSEKGKEAIAMMGYAKALRQLPIAIAENAGYDANELVHDLEIELGKNPDAGINIDGGIIGSMEKLTITVNIWLIVGMLEIKRAGTDISKWSSRDDHEGWRHHHMRPKTQERAKTTLMRFGWIIIIMRC